MKYLDNFECDNILAIPLPPKPSSKPPLDGDAFSDKFWGTLLERSSTPTSVNGSHKLEYVKSHIKIDSNNDDDTSSDKESDVSKTNDSIVSHFNIGTKLEPRFCEHFHDYHDINCAKNRAFFGNLGKPPQDDM